MLALVISILALVVCLSYRRRIESIIEDASSVADLTSKKILLDTEIEQCRKSLDETREELQKLESERRQQESLREELANLSDQVAQEKLKIDEYRKESEDLQNTVSDLKQEYDCLNSEKAEMDIDRDMEKEQLKSEEDAKFVVKLRKVKRHML